MTEWVSHAGWDRRLRIQAWMYSLVLHTAIIGLVTVFGTRMTLVHQEEPFRWNVALVQAVPQNEPLAQAQESSPIESPSEQTTLTQQAAPPKPVVQQASKPMPVERRVERSVQPVMQYVESTPQTPIIEPKPQTVETAQPMERLAEPRPSAVETPPIAAAQAETAPTVIERPAEVSQPSPAPVEHVAETAPAQPAEQPIQHVEEIHQPAPSAEPSTPVVTEREISQPAEEASSPVVQQPVETAKVRQDHEISSLPARPAESATTENQVAQEERTVVAKAGPATTPKARADYGWVRDALWRRIVEMKHYPAQARLNHLEGKVILRAVIRSDGHLGDLSVKESSGHRLLDEAAMDVIRRICPVPMKHALGRPEVVVMIPIDYRLE